MLDHYRINTRPLDHNGPLCLDFWYHMYGGDIGENALQVYMRNGAEGGSEQHVWSESDNQGQEWLHYIQTVYGMSQDMSVSSYMIFTPFRLALHHKCCLLVLK